MDEASEAMKAMARRIVDRWFQSEPHGKVWSVKAARITAEECALAAIIETQRADVELVDDIRRQFGSPTGDAYTCGVWDQGVRIAAQIRGGNHYAKDENNG